MPHKKIMSELIHGFVAYDKHKINIIPQMP